MERILFIGAHPDDVTTGAGGLVRYHVNKGDYVAEVILTKGTHNALNWRTPINKRAQMRVKEELEAENILGVKNRLILNFEDHKIRNDEKTRQAIHDAIKQFKPTILYAPASKHNITWYTHDHIKAGKAAKDVATILDLPLRSYMTFIAKKVIPVPEQDEAIVEAALKAYKSQSFELSLYLALRRAGLRWFGRKVGSKYAEAYREEL